MRIDYKTVGRCVKRTLDVVEPDRKARLNGLVNIGIDKVNTFLMMEDFLSRINFFTVYHTRHDRC